MGKETEDALTIVGCYTYNAFFCDGASIVTGFTTRTSHQSAAIKIDKYRKGISSCLCCRPDVEIETVFATLRPTEGHIAENVELHGVVAKLLRLTNTLPSLNGLGSFPTEFAYRGLGERNTQELLHTVLFETFENTILGFHLKRYFCCLLLRAGTEECHTSDGEHRKCFVFSHNHIHLLVLPAKIRKKLSSWR